MLCAIPFRVYYSIRLLIPTLKSQLDFIILFYKKFDWCSDTKINLHDWIYTFFNLTITNFQTFLRKTVVSRYFQHCTNISNSTLVKQALVRFPSNIHINIITSKSSRRKSKSFAYSREFVNDQSKDHRSVFETSN